MADPFTLGASALGASAGGGILQTVGSLFSGFAKSSSYNYQAGIAEMSAKIAKQNAAYQRQTGEVEAQQVGLKSRAEIGQAKITQAASGFDVAGGSNADVRSSMHDIGVQNQRMVRANAARRAYGAEVEAAQEKAKAGAYNMAADNALVEGFINAGSSILGGSSSVAPKWSAGQQSGLWGGYDTGGFGLSIMR